MSTYHNKIFMEKYEKYEYLLVKKAPFGSYDIVVKMWDKSVSLTICSLFYCVVVYIHCEFFLMCTSLFFSLFW